MKAEGLWLRKQCILLARKNNGSPLDWLGVPLWQIGGWIRATNELDEKRQEKPLEEPAFHQAGETAMRLFDLPGNK